MDRRTFLRNAGLGVAAALGAPVLSGYTRAGSRPRPAGAVRPAAVERLRLAGGSWGYPSPFAYVRGPGLIHTNFLFDTLLWKDASGRPIPWLASSWERSPNGLEYRFRLRSAKWHDGQPLTAGDVAFTFDYLMNGPGKSVPGIFGLPLDFVEDVVAQGSSTVVFRLGSRFAPFEIRVAGLIPIIPEHIWSDVTDPARLRGPEAVTGSGPYRLTGYDEASGAYRYAANTSFFLGAPFVRALEFVPAPDPLLALRRGEIDEGSAPLEEGLPAGALAPFAPPKFGRITAPGEWNRALHFNLTKGFPFDDRRFRQAVAYAINRWGLVRRILFGRGRVGSYGILAPSNPYAADGLPTYPFDRAKAKQLLDQIGLRDREGDGVRELPNGQPFRPELQTSTRFSPQTAEIVQQDLKAVGIDVTLKSLDTTTADTNAAQGNYEMALIGYGGLGGEPDTLRTMLSSKVPSRSFTRVHGYQNARFEELAAAQLQTVVESKRRELIAEMQRIVARDVPVISLYVPTRLDIFVRGLFSAWYYTPGGVFGGYPGVLNKHAFVTGKKYGL